MVHCWDLFFVHGVYVFNSDGVGGCVCGIGDFKCLFDFDFGLFNIWLFGSVLVCFVHSWFGFCLAVAATSSFNLLFHVSTPPSWVNS